MVAAPSPEDRGAGKEQLMESDVVRRLIWSGLLALTGALASIAAHRLSALIWQRVFDEEPPE
jgi:hypothetical protein